MYRERQSREHIIADPWELIFPYCYFRGEENNSLEGISKQARELSNGILMGYLVNEAGGLEGDLDYYIFPPHMAEVIGFAKGYSEIVPEYKKRLNNDKAATKLLSIWASKEDTLGKIYETAELYGELAENGKKMTESILNLNPHGYGEDICDKQYNRRLLGRLVKLFANKAECGRFNDYSDIKGMKNELIDKNFIFPLNMELLENARIQLEAKNGPKATFGGLDRNELEAATLAMVIGLNELGNYENFKYFIQM